MKRIQVRTDNIYTLKLGNGEKVVFHCLHKNSENLYAWIVRVFKKHYPEDDKLNAGIAIKDDVDYYCHVWDIRFGVEDGDIEKIGYSSDLEME